MGSGEACLADALGGRIIDGLAAGTVHASVAWGKRLAAVRTGKPEVALALGSDADAVATARVWANGGLEETTVWALVAFVTLAHKRRRGLHTLSVTLAVVHGLAGRIRAGGDVASKASPSGSAATEVVMDADAVATAGAEVLAAGGNVAAVTRETGLAHTLEVLANLNTLATVAKAL